MKPFNGRCEVPEEEVESGLITISTKHHGGYTKDPIKSSNEVSEKAATKSQGLPSFLHLFCWSKGVLTQTSSSLPLSALLLCFGMFASTCNGPTAWKQCASFAGKLKENH